MGLSRPLLLIVDATGTIQERYRSSLDDFEVHTAGDLAAAWNFLAAHADCKVILLKPEALGARLFPHGENLRSNPATILLTEDESLAEFTAGMNLGDVHRVLHDGVAPEVLHQTVLDAIQGAGHAVGTGENGKVHTPARDGPPPPERRVADASSPYASGSNIDPPRSAELQFKDDWVKVVAHDIRSPLTIINGYTTMLLKQGYNMEKQAELIIDRIRNVGNWMLQLVDNILDQALLEHGKLVLKCAPVTIGEVFSTVTGNLAGMAEANGVLLEWEQQGMERSYILDRIKIEQVLQNIVVNAIKFSSTGGKVHLSHRETEGKLQFQVKDSGSGMTQQQSALVFEKFSSLAETARPGRGLGLAIAKSIVEMHGGEIWLESSPGRGAIFRFTVQPSPENNPGKSPPAASCNTSSPSS